MKIKIFYSKNFINEKSLLYFKYSKFELSNIEILRNQLKIEQLLSKNKEIDFIPGGDLTNLENLYNEGWSIKTSSLNLQGDVITFFMEHD